MQIKYGYIVKNTIVSGIDNVLKLKKIFNSEIHQYLSSTYGYRLYMDGKINDTPNYTQMADYNILWELIYNLLTNSSFFLNKEYENYNCHDVEIQPGVCIKFTRDDIQYILYSSLTELSLIYPRKRRFFVHYEDDNLIDQQEMYSRMFAFCNELGYKFDNVLKHVYKDDNKTIDFYIFYENPKPTLKEIYRILIEWLIKELGYDKAKEKFPNLFVNTYRKIYPLWENRGYPINYELVSHFIRKYQVYRPELLLILNWFCPLVVEHGVTDLVPNYTPITEDDIDSNKFIYYVSKILNYLQGKVLDDEFKKEANMKEEEDWVSFVFKNIEWVVMKNCHIDYQPYPDEYSPDGNYHGQVPPNTGP